MPYLTLSDSRFSVSPKEKKEEEKKNQTPMEGLESVKPKKESKKHKASYIEVDEEKSEMSSELVEMVKKKKKAKMEDEGGEVVENNEEHLDSLLKYHISEPLKAKLREKGIEYLFSIQAMTFNTILDGFDMVGLARTRQVVELRGVALF